MKLVLSEIFSTTTWLRVITSPLWLAVLLDARVSNFRRSSTHLFSSPAGRSTIAFEAAALIFALSGCGEGDVGGVPVAHKSVLAQRAVEVTEMPTLSRCLGQIATALQKKLLRRQVSLDCATGTYRGRTTSGRACSLRVDDEAGKFVFEVEGETVSIKWGDVAYAADGSDVHNLEDASVPAQPGIQLTRFTGSLVPVTEAMILRVGTGVPMIAQMIYQRTTDGATSAVLCKFGK